MSPRNICLLDKYPVRTKDGSIIHLSLAGLQVPNFRGDKDGADFSLYRTRERWNYWGIMLSPEEFHLLETLLHRARLAARGGLGDTIDVGDVVQLRPGADPHWQTSLILVSKVRGDGSVSGQVLRPHRSGCREAWYTYRPVELAKVGHMPYPEPEREVRSQVYCPPCPSCHRAERKPVGRDGGKTARKAAG